MAVPVDPSTGQPVGDPFYADVFGDQSGFMDMDNAKVKSQDKKLTFEGGPPQREHIQFMIGEKGADYFKAMYKCLDDD